MVGVKLLSISCAEIRTSMGLLGSATGFINHGNGTTLNSFLVENDGKHAVVFLDEFDKTDSRVVEALLTICEKGKYPLLI